MAPSQVGIYWDVPPGYFWGELASDILNEQGLEEHMQKSARVNVDWRDGSEGPDWVWFASDILSEQAQENASNEVFSY